MRLAENLLSTGSLAPGAVSLLVYNAKMPVLPYFLAYVSKMTGLSAMDAIRLFLPLMGALSVICFVFVVHRWLGDRLVSLSAGAFLAFSGSYVYVTSAAMKEVLGMFLMPWIIFFFSGAASWRVSHGTLGGLLEGGAVSLLMILLVFTHHLTFLAAATMLFLSSIYSWTERFLGVGHDVPAQFGEGREFLFRVLSEGSFFFLAVVLPGVIGWWYYSSSSLEHYEILTANDKILYLSLVGLWLLFGLFVLMSTDASERRRSSYLKPLLVVLMAFSLLLANHFFSLFGASRTPLSLFLFIVPYVFLVSFSLVGFEVVRSTKWRYKTTVMGMLFAPGVMMTHALVSGLDVTSFNFLYRSYDYADFGLAVCAGIGIAYLSRGRHRDDAGVESVKRGRRGCNLRPGLLGRRVLAGSRRVQGRAAPGVFLVGLSLLTLPMGFAISELHGVDDVTEPYEFSALEIAAHIAERGNLTVYTDQRYHDIISPFFMVHSKSGLPEMMKNNETIPPGTLLVLSESWATEGGQEYPFPRVVVPWENINSTISGGTLLYRIGPAGSQIFIVRYD
ncbi:MAG: hypothetical protein J7L61_00495 [Thermoplasmata archaeon]|nr:hypothetical protein [Thermoplasmata archaeon]